MAINASENQRLGKIAPALTVQVGYDSNGIRSFLLARGILPVIPNNPTRKQHHPFDRGAWRKRNLIERVFCRLKDFRRIATRYDRRADVFLSAVYLAATVTWCL